MARPMGCRVCVWHGSGSKWLGDRGRKHGILLRGTSTRMAGENSENPDGGWGEPCSAYDLGEYVALGNSTPSQTAWALIGLLSCPNANQKVIASGIEYLIHTQNHDGSWNEPEWTGTGFPRHFYLRYDYYRLYWPLMALGRYARTALPQSTERS